MSGDSKSGNLSQFARQIQQYTNERTAARYMDLARQWISSKIRMDQFDRRGRRLEIPLDIHTKFMLEIGDFFDLSFESPGRRLVRQKKRRKKNPNSSSTSNTNITESVSDSASNKESAAERSGNDLSARLLLFAVTNNIGSNLSLMATSSSSQDRAQDFVDNLLFYAGLTKTPHKIDESGFIVLESPINYSTVDESDICTALNSYGFLLPDENKRKILNDYLFSVLFTV